MSHLRQLGALAAVQAVRVVIAARKRVPPDIKRSFFGHYDYWQYVPIFDARLCKKCLKNAAPGRGPRGEVLGYYRGSEIRAKWPYLRILDAETIQVNEHPNCRCILRRITGIVEFFRVMDLMGWT